MKLNEDFLKKVLVDTDLISQKDFNLAQKEALKKNESLTDVIVNQGLIRDEELGKIIADELHFPFIELRKVKIRKEALNIVPENIAQEKEVIIFGKDSAGLKAAFCDPGNIELKEFIERKAGMKILPYYATEGDIREALRFYKKDITEIFNELVKKAEVELKKSSKSESLPIIKMVDLILSYGQESRASDIHLEPYREKTLLRYRIDGVLHDILELPPKLHEFLVSRIKIISKLRTDIHEAAQDGHFSFSAPDEKIDVRVSVMPIEEGEKIVLRLLSGRARKFELSDLGLEASKLKIVEENIKKSWGMVLVSGPTGSGKTTTLYATLKILNTREVNICTIEDPIEYDIEGINQIQVNTKTGLTFSQGLKSIIRQDPNIIMVGEIRDTETAKLATNAAMTGHLLLSTFHATDAATTLPRLLEMGVEPFLVASTVNLIIAERLVRKICPRCAESCEISQEEVFQLIGEDLAKKLPKTDEGKIRICQGRGCSLCQQTGYLGRTGIFEVLEIKEPIKKLIIEKASADQIRKSARELGMQTMVEDGLAKIERGITTLEEVARAVRE